MEKTILHRDINLFYQVRGEGKALMLLHGFGEDGDIWKYQLPAMEQHYKVIVPDLPGSGRSQQWMDLSMESMAESLIGIMQAENLETITLIGHSMGGYIALAFAARYPMMLDAFGLFHSTAFADSEEKKEFRKKGIGFIRNHGSYEFLKQSIPSNFGPVYKTNHPEKINELVEKGGNFQPDALAGYFQAMMERPDRTHVLKEFKKPILFIAGQHDTAVPPEDSLKQCHLPEFSYIHMLKLSGHMGLWEETEETNRILKEFLERL